MRGGLVTGMVARCVPAMVATAMLAVVGLGGWMVARGVAAAQLDAARSETLDALSGMRARLESAVNANILLAEGIAAFVAANPGVGKQEFQAIARNLLVHRSQIINIALAHGTTMTYVYPEAGNEAIVGLDYRSLPKQWPAVRRAIEHGETVLAGPVDLIQGGRAVIGRTPIFLPKPGAAAPSYWGLVAIPIDMDALLDAAGLMGKTPVEVAIRGRDGRGARGGVFFGDAALFDRDPVMLTVSLPGGEWQMAATPRGGWPGIAAVAWAVGGGTLFLGVVLSGLVYGAATSVLRTRDVTEWAADAVDPRTGLTRSGYFLLACEQRRTEAQRRGRPLALLAVRADGLADIRRAGGPEAVQRVLTAVADVCRSSGRTEDFVGSVDGEVIGMILAGVGRDAAVMTAERLHRAVKAAWPAVGGQPRQITVSIGLATLDPTDISAAVLVSRALERLNRARASGRGQIAA